MLKSTVKKAKRLFDKITSPNIYHAEVINILKSPDVNNVPQKTERPISCMIEITNTCNLNCTMCNTKSSNRPPGFMSLELFDRVIKDLKKIGIKRAGLHTVGEPFMYKNLHKLLKIMKESSVKPFISTNGQFPDRIKSILKHHESSEIDFRFSVDAATKQYYESVRIGAKFERLIESLDIVRSFKNKSENNIRVSANYCINKVNFNEIGSFLDHFKEYFDPDDISFHLINGLSLDNSFFLKAFPFPNLIRKGTPCRMPFRNLYITYDGGITLCCRDYNGELVVGDIKEGYLLDIWNNRTADYIRSQHLGLNPVNIKACIDCKTPYRFVDHIINLYIHFLYKKSPGEYEKVGDEVWNMLGIMNELINKDRIKFENYVLSQFSS